MRSSHGNEDQGTDHGDVPRRVERSLERCSTALAPTRLTTNAGDGPHLTGHEIGRPHDVILGIRDVEHVGVEGQTLRAIVLGAVERSVRPARRAGADDTRHAAVEVRHQHAMVVGIRDEQTFARLVCEHLPRKRQSRRAQPVSFE